MKALLCLTALTLTGCALAPNTVRTEVQHLSHISQHFGSNATNTGAQMAQVIAQWKWHGAFVEVGEGYNFSQGEGPGWAQVCAGGICGKREITTAAVGYIWQVKP